LIDDVARERAKFERRRVSPKPLSATNARDATHVGAEVGLPSSHERRAQEVTRLIGTPTLEDDTLGTHSPQRALKRSNGGPDPSPGLVVDSATKCVEAPVGLASEGEHWYYRLDRKTHRKCWYVRAFKEDGARSSIAESDQRLSEPTSPDPSIRIGLGITCSSTALQRDGSPGRDRPACFTALNEPSCHVDRHHSTPF
jgi:hypothetical protein